jgi:lysophospholipase L1-like esterase
MTKIQNLWTKPNIVRLILWFLLLGPSLSAQSLSPDQGICMLALGDSYTIGESVDMNERWPHQLVDELRERGFEARDPDYLAATGWTTTDLLEAMSGSLNREKAYNLVSILIGVNNQYQGLDIKRYEPELKRIIDMAIELAGGLESRVIMLSIPDYAFTPFGKNDPDITREINAYNDIKQQVAREYGIAFIDITPISRRGLTDPALVAGDGLHPSGEQYRAWVEKLCCHLCMTAQNDSADFAQIRRILLQQEKDWNRGDIEAFMEAYWKIVVDHTSQRLPD